MLRPMAGAMIRSSAIKRSNCEGNIDWAPSLSARSGSQCTSMIRPSAPAATAARAIGATMSRRPAPWLGSATIGRWLSFLTTGIAEMSNVLRVAVSNVRIPRSQRVTSLLPPLSTYSADSSHSSIFAEPLEAVRRAARLERPAAEDLRACAPHGRRRRPHLRLALRRAGAGHDDHFVAADPHLADADHGAFRLERAAGELVRLRDAQDFVHAIEQLDDALVRVALPHRAEDRARHAGRSVHVHAHLDETGDHLFDLRF